MRQRQKADGIDDAAGARQDDRQPGTLVDDSIARFRR